MRTLVTLCAVLTLGLLGAAKSEELHMGPLKAVDRDWLYPHRAVWDVQRRTLSTAELSAWVDANPNSFFDAAVSNTKARRAGEYKTIRQRQSYYDYMAHRLERASGDNAALRDIKFFHAATSVTIQAELGIAESLLVTVLEEHFPSLAKKFGVTKGSIELLTQINADLFSQNMEVIANLLYVWREPRDPRAISPRTPISALDFDLAMVEFEQDAVEGVITKKGASDAALDDINTLLRKNNNPLSVVNGVEPWVKKAGFGQRDFKNRAWRIAVGRALVFRFHKQSEATYLAYMKAHPPKAGVRRALYDGLIVPDDAGSKGSFAVVGSWRTEKGAMRHLAELRERNRGLNAAVYPPYGAGRYWTVAVSSFAPPDTARELAQRARRAGVAKDAFVVRWRAVDSSGREFLPHPTSIQIADTPKLLNASHGDLGSSGRDSVVTVFSAIDQAEAAAWVSKWKARFPDIEFAVIRVGQAPTYQVALALHANRVEAAAAMELARRIGIPNGQVAHTLIDPTVLVEVLTAEGPSSSQAWEIVSACYRQGKVTVGSMQACSGYWLTPSTLTRCLLESDCRVLTGAVLATEEQKSAFLAVQGLKLDSMLPVLASAVPIPSDAQTLINKIDACRAAASGSQAKFVGCINEVVPSNAKALECLRPEMPNNESLACLASASKASTLSAQAHCFKNDFSEPAALAACLSEPSTAAAVAQARPCLEKAKTSTDLLSDCLTPLLPDEQAQRVECLSRPNMTPAATVECVLPQGGQAAAAAAAFRCVAQSGADRSRAAQCVAGIANADAAKVGACVAANATSSDAATCVLEGHPEVQAARDAYNCATSGTDAMSLIANCTGAAVSNDAKDIARCVSKFSGDSSALAGCAAASLLPPEWASLAACAADSEGAVGIALCLAAPSMNEEWRIAAECASSSGGEPVTFAGCTGGRLTVRELEKCISGQIGKDCLGPNNTVIVAFNTVGNDLSGCLSGQACLGPNNDLVKASNAVSSAIQHVGQEAENILSGLFGEDSAVCRGDLTGWIC